MKTFISSNNSKIILLILFFTILFDQSGVLIIMPVLPDLLHEVTGKTVAATAQIGGFLAASYALMQLLFGPIIGKLSDHYGRRKILLIASFVFIFDYLIMAMATELWMLFLGRVLAGITGACVVTALASVADISTPENKTKNYAFVYAAMGLGLVIGPLISAFSMRLGANFDLGARAPFYLAGIIALLNFLVILLFMPETLDQHKRRQFKLENPVRSLLKMSAYPGLKHMFFAHFMFIIAFQAPLILLTFFVKERLNWSSIQTADLLVWHGIWTIIVQIVLVPKLYPKLGNMKICYLGMTFFVLSLLTMIFANSGGMLYLMGFLLSLGTVSNSAFSSLYTSQVKENEQGELQGVITSCISLGTIIGLLVMTDIFKLSIQHNILFRESNPFILSVILTLICITFLTLAFKKLLYKS